VSIPTPAVTTAIGLPPEQAIAHLQAKGAQVTGSWREWLDGQHARAFTVANVAKLEVLQDIQASLKDALAKGQTLQQWRDGLIPTLQRKGWWQREGTTAELRQAGRVDEASGEIRKGLTPHRLRTIFATNMQSAYMAGRYQQMIEQVDERPFWQYVAVLDSRTRPAHRALNGKVFRYDDAAWGTAFPPNGFNCRCRVRALSERDVRRAGVSVESSQGKLREVRVPLKGGGEATGTRYVDASLPGGGFTPDPGFSSNPGRDTWQPRLQGMDVALSRQYVETAVAGPAFRRFVEQPGAGTLFPVAVLREADRAALQAEASVAYLSGDTLAKKQSQRPDLTLDDWKLIPQIVDEGEVYRDKDGYTLLYLATQTQRWWRLALKTTKGRDQLFVQSLAGAGDDTRFRANLANKQERLR
jgi:SPP1 gp7 family putative phage head morphogenesis protein